MAREFWTTARKDHYRIAGDGTVYLRTRDGPLRKVGRVEGYHASREAVRLRDLDREREKLEARSKKRRRKVKGVKERREKRVRLEARRLWAAYGALVTALALGAWLAQ